MDEAIVNFLNKGPAHPTRASHRTAAKKYAAFLLANKDCSFQDKGQTLNAFHKFQKKSLEYTPVNRSKKIFSHYFRKK